MPGSPARRRGWYFVALVCLVVAATPGVWNLLLKAQQNQPVFVGARVCGQCHDGAGMGNQYSHWLNTKHARTYAVLGLPEARKIAELSGVKQEPQEAAICLGCHSSGGAAEDWQKDESFHIEDGVQCETCHGPGSEYMSEAVMRDKEASRKAGLRVLKPDFCINCHIEKGTHVAVLGSKVVDTEKGWVALAHPTPDNPVVSGIPKTDVKPGEGRRYIGSRACGACHKGMRFGYQQSRWRLTAHARAYAALSTPKGLEYAKQAGVRGDPIAAPECLKCHATGRLTPGALFAEGYSVDDGVGCESCHGAGSDYAAEAVMRDPRASAAAGLQKGAGACAACHANAHGKPFGEAAAMKAIAHPTRLPQAKAEPRYKNPLNMALRPGSRELWVTCQASDSVIVVDADKWVKIAEIPIGSYPEDIAFTPDGKLAFASNLYGNTVSVIDTSTRMVVRTLPTGPEPHGLAADGSGRYLYVLNCTSGDISVFDLATFEEVKRLTASRRPWAISLSPDKSRLLVTHSLSRFGPLRTPSISEITALDTERGRVDDRFTVNGANQMLGIAWHPSGKFAIATANRTKNLVPMTRLQQGWTITNGMAVLWDDGRVDQVLLDEPGEAFPDPTDVAFTPDGKRVLITSSGSNRVGVVDIAKLTDIVTNASEYERARVIPNHLGYATQFMIKRIPVPDSPRGVLVDSDGRHAFVANSLDDSISVIDMEKLEAVKRVDLGGPKEITEARYGERLFHNAKIAFHRQFSCHTCHPDGHVDGLTYDIEADGIGIDPVDNRTLRGILDTAPFKWVGTNPSLQRQCGPRLAVFFTRVEPFNPTELRALDLYISRIVRPPNPYHPLGSPYTPAQRRGKLLFERTRTNDGREIPDTGQCAYCHFAPYYTNRRQFDVGTRQDLDRASKFDVPHLNNIYDSAPYLHNGMASTLEEIWTVYNPNDLHGFTNDMTKDQLNDLVEYLKTL